MTLTQHSRYILLTLLVLGAVTIFLARDHFDVVALEQWVLENPLSAPFLFIALYVVLALLLFPSLLLSLTGGLLFGPLWGTLYVQTSVVLSAAIAFLLARYLLAEWVESRLGEDLKKLKTGVEKRGWRFVFLLRLVPGLPFAFLNYALGLTRIRLDHFLAATFVCLLPRVILYAIAGDTGKKAVAGQDIRVELLIAAGLFLTIILLPYAVKKLRQQTR